MTEADFGIPYSITFPASGSEFDQHYWGAWQTGTVCEYEAHEDTLTIDAHDEVWGDEQFGEWEGDHIFFRLYLNPLVQRTVAVEQLTLPKIYSTMPGSFDMKRFEHAYGSVIFVRKMLRKAETDGQVFEPREKLLMQLRTFISDLGHTAFSHLGDWIKQGFGGSEDSHDITLPDLLRAGGVTEILEDEGFTLDELLDTEDDWIERDAPELCTDRIDYGARQINRCFEYEPSREWLDKFSLDDKHGIVMKNHAVARDFALKFGLLATESFNHPVQRLQLNLFAALAKALLIEGVFSSRVHGIANPLDDMYAVDHDLMVNMRQAGNLYDDLHALLIEIGRSQRRIFAMGRYAELSQFLSDSKYQFKRGEVQDFNPAQHFPDPLRPITWQAKSIGTTSPHLEFEEVDEPDVELEEQSNVLTFKLPALKPDKPRYIDPLFYDENGKVVKLSEADSDFKRLIDENIEIQRRHYIGRIHAAPAFVTRLLVELEELNEVWSEQTQKSRADDKQMRGIIDEAAMLAIGRHNNRVRLVR